MTKQPLGSNKYVSWVLYVKFRIHKRDCLLKHFAFLKNVCHQYLNFVLGVTYCFFLNFLKARFRFLLLFTSCWLAYGQLSRNVFLFSRNPIGQFCLGGPGYSSRTVARWKASHYFSLEALKHAAAVLIRVCLWTRERFRVVFASRFMIPTRLFLQIHDSRRLLITWT